MVLLLAKKKQPAKKKRHAAKQIYTRSNSISEAIFSLARPRATSFPSPFQKPGRACRLLQYGIKNRCRPITSRCIRLVEKLVVKVLENIPATPTVHLVRFASGAGNPFEFKPGQFAMVHVPQPGGKELPRPYSFASSPAEKRFFELCVKRVPAGPGSNYICDAVPGQGVTVSGPYGLFGLRGAEEKIVFCASGTGVAPFKSMLDLLFAQGTSKQVWLLFGVRNRQEIAYDKEFREMAAAHSNFHYYPILSDEDAGDWTGEKGFVPGIIERLFGRDAGGTEFYACGVPIMVEKTREKLLQMGVPKEKIFAELYR